MEKFKHSHKKRKEIFSCEYGLKKNLIPFNNGNKILYRYSLHKICPYSELFWSVFSRIWTEYGEVRGRDVSRNLSKIYYGSVNYIRRNSPS